MTDKDPKALRVSDAERAQYANTVDAAVADGRLTWTEHYERSAQVWAARTRGELEPTIADLGQPPATVNTTPPQRVTAMFSKTTRVPSVRSSEILVRATFGAVVLDLSVMRPGERIQVRASSFCGKVIVKVADDATVFDDGGVFLGKRSMGQLTPQRGGPVVHITGMSAFGNLKVFRASQGEWHEDLERMQRFHHRQHEPYPYAGPQEVHLHRDKHVHIHKGKQIYLGGGHPGHHGHHDMHHWGHRRRRKWDGYW